MPEGRPVTLPTLVRVAGMRWPVEEGFRIGKVHFGLDHSQVRLYHALTRHIVLAMTALAICAVTTAACVRGPPRWRQRRQARTTSRPMTPA